MSHPAQSCSACGAVGDDGCRVCRLRDRLGVLPNALARRALREAAEERWGAASQAATLAHRLAPHQDWPAVAASVVAWMAGDLGRSRLVLDVVREPELATRWRELTKTPEMVALEQESLTAIHLAAQDDWRQAETTADGVLAHARQYLPALQVKGYALQKRNASAVEVARWRKAAQAWITDGAASDARARPTRMDWLLLGGLGLGGVTTALLTSGILWQSPTPVSNPPIQRPAAQAPSPAEPSPYVASEPVDAIRLYQSARRAIAGGDAQVAESLLVDATKDERVTYVTDDVLYDLMRLTLARGDSTQAARHADSLLERFPQSMFANSITRRIAARQ